MEEKFEEKKPLLRLGDEIIVPPRGAQEAAEKRLQEGYECVDWFLCKKKLP